MSREDLRALFGDRPGRDSRLLRRFSLAASRETSLVGGSGGGKSGYLRLALDIASVRQRRTRLCRVWRRVYRGIASLALAD